MKNPAENLVITGIGVATAAGVGKVAFAQALREGRSAFGYLARPGRVFHGPEGEMAFIGAEIDEGKLPLVLDARTARTASWCGRVAAATLSEAWDEAALAGLQRERVGLVLGGGNLQQRELANLHDELAQRRQYVRPSVASGFLDTDVLALCCERQGIRGPSFACAAASASGQFAVIQAALAVLTGQLDACIALGGLMDLSFWELQALRSAGAMGGEMFADAPERACRPFDHRRDGFIFGESCAALVVEREEAALARSVAPYASLVGWSIVNEGTRSTSPSLRAEVDALRRAVQTSGARPEEVDYYNAHGTGSILGDEIELQAIHEAGLSGAFVNATKSITGHGLTAAGAVEIAATLLQMKGGWLHPTLNLEQPVDPHLRWITGSAVTVPIDLAVSLSLGFGGFNTAVCLRKYRTSGASPG
jgi:malonyl-[acp] decarboxylase